MAQELVSLEKQLKEYRKTYGLRQTIPCSKEENKAYLAIVKNEGELPEGVCRYKYTATGEEADEFYTAIEPELTSQEMMEYLTYKQLDLMRTIKSCVVFFTALTIIGMVLAFFWGMMIAG